MVKRHISAFRIAAEEAASEEFLAKYANFNKRDTFMDIVEKKDNKENGNGEE